MSLVFTSAANPRLKALRDEVRGAGRHRTHTLLLGAKLVEAWMGARAGAGARLAPQRWLRREDTPETALERALPLETWLLTDRLMAQVADGPSAPELILQAEVGPEPAGPLADWVIAPWGIQDPGNLGAILRSAAAFGFQEALLGPGCADPFSPKALRGSMGAAFLLPLRRMEAIPLDGGHWFALDGGPGALPLAEADLSPPLRLLVGNEGHGWEGVDLPQAVRRLAIPMQGVESLNAAVAAGIACFEAARRRP